MFGSDSAFSNKNLFIFIFNLFYITLSWSLLKYASGWNWTFPLCPFSVFEAKHFHNLFYWHAAQSSGKYEQSLKKSQTTLMKVEKWGEDRVQNKHAVVANLYSCIGNAYLEMEKYKEALDFHNKDLYLGREQWV